MQQVLILLVPMLLLVCGTCIVINVFAKIVESLEAAEARVLYICGTAGQRVERDAG